MEYSLKFIFKHNPVRVPFLNQIQPIKTEWIKVTPEVSSITRIGNNGLVLNGAVEDTEYRIELDPDPLSLTIFEDDLPFSESFLKVLSNQLKNFKVSDLKISNDSIRYTREVDTHIGIEGHILYQNSAMIPANPNEFVYTKFRAGEPIHPDKNRTQVLIISDFESKLYIKHTSQLLDPVETMESNDRYIRVFENPAFGSFNPWFVVMA